MPSLPATMNDLDEALKKAEYAAAAAEAREATTKIASGAEMIERGDTLGGAAAVLDGLGQFIAMGATFLGPMGALAGGLFSLVTSIVSAILEAFAPPQKSLEAKIKDIIESDDMKKLRAELPSENDMWVIMTGGFGGGGTLDKMAFTRKAIADAKLAQVGFVFDSNTMRWPASYETRFEAEKDPNKLLSLKVEALAVGLTWDEVKAEADPEAHISKVVSVINQLQTYSGLQDLQWSSLLDEAVGYLFQTWISLHQLEGLVSPDALGRLQDTLLSLAKTQKNHLDAMEYVAQNNVEFYARWHTNAGGGPEVYDWWYEPFSRRHGVINSTDEWKEVGGGKTSNFAVSSGGTLFGCSTNGKVSAGRGDMEEAENSPSCVEVFISDAPAFGGSIRVACTDASGRALWMGSFNDTAPLQGGDGNAWVAHQERWGEWHKIDLPFRIGSVAMVPTGNGTDYAIYVVAMRDEWDVILYDVKWDGTCTAVDGFYWSNDDVRAAMGWNLYHSGVDAQGKVTQRWWGSADETHKASLSCAISLSPFAVQVGNKVKILQDGQVVEWDLAGPSFLASGALRTHQGRFYPDGTFVLCSNQGLFMRYWDSKNNTPQWMQDKAVQTECVQKMTLENGPMYRALQRRFAEVIAAGHG